MTKITYGSVCSGIEAASVAWHPLGWRAAWLAEIEPFPCAVLAHHYPDVPNLGDMTKLPNRIRVGEIEAPDIFCGGTPCQAFSVAGLRKSLDDARGNLSLIFCEIANEIDSVRLVRGEQPAVVFWENVPGVLNTKDNAFGCFLAGLAGEDEPLVPAGGKWTNAGCVFGPKRTVAWRVLDAQYFGVAQRRRRVFVVASARTGFDPVSVLFEFDGVRRDFAPSREAREVAPTIPARSLGGGGLGTDFDCDGGVIEAIGHGVDLRNGTIAGDLTQTIQAGCSGHSPDPAGTPHVLQPVAFANVGHFGSMQEVSVSDPLRAKGGDTGNGGESLVAQCITGDITHTLKAEGFDASEDGTGRGTPMVPTIAFSCKDNGRDCTVELSPTLRGREGGSTAELGDEVQNCLRASGGGGDKAHVLAPVAVDFRNMQESDAFSTMQAKKTGYSLNAMPAVRQAMQVRRLTPVECERLQGFPDSYTMIPWRKKPADQCPDGPRYKALGNSWAVPNVRWIGRRIAGALA